MREWIGIGVVGAVLGIWADPAGAAALLIRNAVVKVTVVPEDRADIDVKILKANPRLLLTVQPGLNGDIVVDGSRRYGMWGFILGGRTTNCRREAGEPLVHVWGLGDVRGKDMPEIVVQVPLDAKVSTSGATYGSIGRSESVDLRIAGCDDWTIANVARRLTIDDAGVARVRAGTSGSMRLDVAGYGDVKTGDVSGGLETHIAGAADIEHAAVSGPIEVHIAGHGVIRILGGHAAAMEVHIAGAGSIDDKGTADTLNAEIAGVGTINVAHVTGAITRSIAGVGTVNVGR
jgi:hypothetical protein